MHRLQYISQGRTVQEHLMNIEAVLEAGGRFIQLRLKNVPEEELRKAAIAAKGLCITFNADLIINDHPHIAVLSKARGVHVGLNDMPVASVRALNKELMIGGSANTLADVEKRVQEGVDYIGLGPFRFTTTKEKLSPVLGLNGYNEIISQMRQKGSHIPVFAIGGIEEKDLEGLAQSGVYGIAVSGSLTHSKEKYKLIQRINSVFNHV